MCYNNSSAVEVCVLHSRPRTPLRGAPVPFRGTPRNCLTPQRLIFRSQHNFVGFVRSVMIVDVSLNIHESGKCAVGKQFVYVFWTFDCRAGINKHISRTHMSQQCQQRMCHVYITIPIVCFQVGSEREEWCVLIKKPLFLTVVKRSDQLLVCIHSTLLFKNIP
jgi:hypothetical protein